MAKSKGYDFNEVELRIKKFWDDQSIFKFDSGRNSGKKIFSVDTPPPYISGKMHIGHAFSYAQQDFIARFRRMKSNVFYPFGTDDNGLPTERFIEKLKGVKSKDMGRADFIKLCLDTLKEITPDCISDFVNLGISADYNIYYSTLDEHSQKVSQASFLDLFNKGEVVKKGFPTIWCPECQTAIAQAELEDKEKSSPFIYIRAEVEGMDPIVFATTRPELLPACVCISVHKDDLRYKDYVGKTATIPLSGAKVPIIIDEFAKMDFGSGAVYWCPYGDKNDVSFIARHPEFTPIIILNKDGTMNEKAINYAGLKIMAARKKITDDLQAVGAIEKVETIQNVSNTHDKCGTEIEFLPVEQWFIKIMDKKDKLITQGNKIVWYPDYMKKRYENWVNGLEWDWNISRNRHFGVPIPVWECGSCNEFIVPSIDELPVDPLQITKNCPKCKKPAIGESMVLDTWATSSMTPQIASSLVDSKVSIPYSLRPQGHDIIRTWAFYTIVKAFLHEGKIPWSDIMVSGNVSLKGEKMSKSKGNVVDPRKVMGDFGADALRFWAAGSKLGGDLDYQEQDLIAGKKTINKLINATKFVFMNMPDYDGKAEPKGTRLCTIDILLLKKLNDLVDLCTKAFENYEYSKAKMAIEHFFWKDFCDNYLEIVKKRLYAVPDISTATSEDMLDEGRPSAKYTLYNSLLVLTKLFAPIMPFITEELYQKNFKENEGINSIHLSSWPEKIIVPSGIPCMADFDSFTGVLSRIRQEKTIAKKAMNARIILTLPKDDLKKLGETLSDLEDVTNAKEIREGSFNVEFVEENNG